MAYCITSRGGVDLPMELDRDFETIDLVISAFEAARRQVSEDDLLILRDGGELSKDVLDDPSHYQVLDYLGAHDEVRSGFRTSRSGDADLARSPTGPVAVWKPANPEDRFQ